ncbi:MAG: class I SAM-dependent methyltransferase, partial [Leptolyngbyaceae cyanobacterium SM2_5_2]|nr:class I SAM-dependent methyltransferase [Leptolyngbyaceae cyanobacterium SM2_5_2]
LHAPQAITDVNTVQMDMTCLALPDAAFDVILCNHVLEHVPDDRAAMLEMRRVLRPGGWALVTVPIWMDRPTHEEPGHHLPS